MLSDTRLGPADQNGIGGNHGYEGSASQFAASPLQESPRLPQRNYNNTFASCASSTVLFSIQSSSVQYCTHFYTARICMYITYSVACHSYLIGNGANEIASRSRGSTHPSGAHVQTREGWVLQLLREVRARGFRVSQVSGELRSPLISSILIQ
jgi:hypothetical protein